MAADLPALVPVLALVVPALVRVVEDNRQILMNVLEKLFTRQQGSLIALPGAGVYHFVRESGSDKVRIHLRIDQDGSGLLIINANRIFQLNPTAIAMAYFSLNHYPADSAIHSLNHLFEGKNGSLPTDYQIFISTLEDLIYDQGCPICDLDLETSTPFSTRPSAPYRMDLALTYRCNNACSHCYNGRSRNHPEISTESWFKIIDRLWSLGIPHLVFTGGEPTLRDDLPELIRYAEKTGQITGLNTNGRKLKDPNYVKLLVDAGLDHVQITMESHKPEIHDLMVHHPGAWEETVEGIKNVLKTRLYVMTNTTMLTHNQSSIPETLEFLADIGLPTVGLNALIYSGKGKTVGTGLSESDLMPILKSAQEITSTRGQKLIWYTPTQYCNFDPILMGLGVKGCTAALFNMCVEPDGNVLPCQSYYTALGNILTDSWDSIWNHDLSVSLRERRNLPEKCNDCMIYNECGGGCPLTHLPD